jgi:hypothetical protein
MSFIQPIIYLVLVIAVGAVGANFIDDGVLGFKDKAKAQGIVELADDIKTAMDTFKADQSSSLSLPFVLEDGTLGLSEGTPVTDGLVSFEDVVGVLGSADYEYLSGNGQPSFGEFALSVANGKVFLMNSSAEISDEICAKINEVTGATDTAAADLTTVLTTTPTSLVAVAELDALMTVSNGVEAETVKAQCFEATDGSGNNTFVYFLQDY